MQSRAALGLANLRRCFSPAIRYIEYEKQVEALRVMRKKSRRLHGKPSLADHAGPRRIHFIFERSTRKFAGDLALWSRWLGHCRESGTTRRTSRVRVMLEQNVLTLKLSTCCEKALL